jgi:predicted DCC family thiol-disulfide oxidoreductase YuxK
MSNTAVATRERTSSWTIVFDNTCPLIARLGWLVRQWDREHVFRYVGRDADDTAGTSKETGALLQELDRTPWSLLLLDEDGNTWAGPEAVPFILKNLPSGKLAAVAYTLPGTMWLTRQLYLLVSRNRRKLSHLKPRLSESLPSAFGKHEEAA